MIKLLIYDLDGTLIDSSRDIATAVNAALKEMNLPELSVKKISSFVSSGVMNLMNGVLKEALRRQKTPDESVQMDSLLKRSIQLYRMHYAKHLLDETELYPSVRTVLEYFKNRKQAIITNKPEEFSNKILSSLKIDSYFFKVIGADQKFPKKPAPESVLEIIKLARVDLNETIFIGDSSIDIETGRNAKIKTVAVTYGFSSREEIKRLNPDLVVDNLAELIKYSLLS